MASNNQSPRTVNPEMRAHWRNNGDDWVQLGFGPRKLRFDRAEPGDALTEADPDTGEFLPPNESRRYEEVTAAGPDIVRIRPTLRVSPQDVIAAYLGEDGLDFQDLTKPETLELAKEAASELGWQESRAGVFLRAA